jgi:hypothetical protein
MSDSCWHTASRAGGRTAKPRTATTRGRRVGLHRSGLAVRDHRPISVCVDDPSQRGALAGLADVYCRVTAHVGARTLTEPASIHGFRLTAAQCTTTCSQRDGRGRKPQRFTDRTSRPAPSSSQQRDFCSSAPRGTSAATGSDTSAQRGAPAGRAPPACRRSKYERFRRHLATVHVSRVRAVRLLCARLCGSPGRGECQIHLALTRGSSGVLPYAWG